MDKPVNAMRAAFVELRQSGVANIDIINQALDCMKEALEEVNGACARLTVGSIDSSADDKARVRAFVAQYRARQFGKTLDAAAKQHLDTLEPRILEYYQRTGTQRENVDGMTVSLRRDLFPAVPADRKEDLIAALKDDDDTAYMVSEGYSHMTLGAWIRELPEDEQTGMPVIPDKLKGMLEVSEKFSVRCTAGG